MDSNRDATASQADLQQEDPDYNGEDFTRPQRGLGFRPQYRTSSGPTSKTDRWIEQLRYNARLDLGRSWRLGYLLQLPVIEQTTTSFVPQSIGRDAGLVGLRAGVTHPNYKLELGIRLRRSLGRSRPRHARKRQMADHARLWGSATPSWTPEPTPILYLLSDTQSVSLAIRTGATSTSRR